LTFTMHAFSGVLFNLFLRTIVVVLCTHSCFGFAFAVYLRVCFEGSEGILQSRLLPCLLGLPCLPHCSACCHPLADFLHLRCFRIKQINPTQFELVLVTEAVGNCLIK
jgi:hypothetical protein